MKEQASWEKQFEAWVESLCKYGHEPLRYVQWNKEAADGATIGLRAKVFTDRYVYSFSANASYLGCGASARKPRAGETWTRGNDLPDGKFCEETWRKIVLAIVRYELVELEGTNSRVGTVEEGPQSDVGEPQGKEV